MAKAIRTLPFLSSVVILLANMKESEKRTITKKGKYEEEKYINPNPKSVVSKKKPRFASLNNNIYMKYEN